MINLDKFVTMATTSQEASMKASMKISPDDSNSTKLENLAISIKFLILVKKLLFVICYKKLEM